MISMKGEHRERVYMKERLLGLSMTILMLFSVIVSPASAQEVEDRKQPSVDNPHMHFWGTSDLSSCWTHFDANDSAGSAQEAYGEKYVTSGRNEVDFTCRMQDLLKEDMYLDANGTIMLEFTVDAYSPGQCTQANQCEELNVTIYQGTVQVAKEQFNGIDSGNADSRAWQIDVDSNMTRWNKSGEEPVINFRWVGVADAGLQCVAIYCDSYFRFYYSNTQDEQPPEMNFPVVNMSEAMVDGENPEGEEGGGFLPGFGLLGAISALAIAATSYTNRKSD